MVRKVILCLALVVCFPFGVNAFSKSEIQKIDSGKDGNAYLEGVMGELYVDDPNGPPMQKKKEETSK